LGICDDRLYLQLVQATIEDDVVPLRDMYGPSGDRDYLQALVVSKETEKGGAMVNDKRKENGVPLVDIIVVDLASSSGSHYIQDKLSSTAIRQFVLNKRAEDQKWMQEQWLTLCQKLNVSRQVGEKWWSVLSERYHEAQRHYHTINHILHMLKLFEQVSSGSSSSSSCSFSSSPSRVLLAIWFHDVIYEPTAKDNEYQSAQLFVEFAKEAQLSSNDSHLVVEYIMSTIKHQPTELLLKALVQQKEKETEKEKEKQKQGEQEIMIETEQSQESKTDTEADTQPETQTESLTRTTDYHQALREVRLLLDLDLAILAASTLDYDAYARAIRLEYQHFPDAAFRSGRIAVLRSLLSKPSLYDSDDQDLDRAIKLKTRWEGLARFNMQREIRRLQNEAIPLV